LVMEHLPRLSIFFDLPTQVDALLQLSIVLLSDQKLTQKQLKDFGDAFKIDGSIVDGIVSIAQKNFHGIVVLAERFGNYESKRVEMLVNLVENLRMLSATYNKEQDAGSTAIQQAITEGPGAGEQKVQEVLQELSYKDLFVMFDKDQSGDIKFEEFLDLVKYLQLNLTETQSLRIFSQSAKADGFLDKDEFEKAMTLLRESISKQALHLLGMSSFELAVQLLIRLVILMAMFGFIFLGIAAFTQGTAFESVVNSFLSVGAALGLGSGTDNPSVEDRKSEAKDTVKAVFNKIKKAT